MEIIHLFFEIATVYMPLALIFQLITNLLEIPLSLIGKAGPIICIGISYYFQTTFLSIYISLISDKYNANVLSLLAITSVFLVLIAMSARINKDNSVGAIFYRLIFPTFGIAYMWISCFRDFKPFEKLAYLYISFMNKVYDMPIIGNLLFFGFSIFVISILLFGLPAILYALINSVKKISNR